MPTQIETPTVKKQITLSETTPGSDIVYTTEDGDADDATNILMDFSFSRLYESFAEAALHQSTSIICDLRRA